jgi:hypothetical protein
MALTETRATQQVREEVTAIDQSLEDSFADFESNYQGLIEKSFSSSSANVMSSSLTSSSTLINSNGGNSRSSAFNELMLSPSASNLASLGRTRAKDIEAALRHRRQQQLVLNRSDTSSRNSCPVITETASTDVSSQSNGSSQQLKSKMSWLLEQKDASSAPLIPRESETVKAAESAAPFVNRVRNLEAKFHANSGLHALDMTAYEQSDQKKNIISKGSSVMTAANTLEQLLNPRQQEVRLKEKAGDYRKKTHDIKVVMKMTKETDWNKKCWEEREKQAQGKRIVSYGGFDAGVCRKKFTVQTRVRDLIYKLSHSPAARGRCRSRTPFSIRRFIAMSRCEANGTRSCNAAHLRETFDTHDRVFRDEDADQETVTQHDTVTCDESDALFCSRLCSLFFHFSSHCLLIAFALIFAYFSFQFGL